MRLTRIDFEGRPGHYATAQRRDNMHNGPDIILVTIFQPDLPDGRQHYVNADCREDIWSMAECLQPQLDGCRGTNSMIHEYFNDLLRLSNI